MNIAHEVAKMSYARRLKVGSVIVKDDRIISMGYNGMPAGWDNNCEREQTDENGQIILVTRPEVLHAEMNSLMKLAKSNESGDKAMLFVTHSPCLECAKGIYQAGISTVFYGEKYRSNDGIEFLNKCDVIVKNFNN